MKADLLESNKVLSIIMEQVCTFKHLKAEFPESKEEESAFEKQEVIDKLQEAKNKLRALELMCVGLHTMIDQCSRILGGRWKNY